MFDNILKEIDANYHIEYVSKVTSEFWWVPWVSVTAYLVLVAAGRKWMENRQPYGLRRYLFLWNIFLASFSIVGTICTLPALIDIVWSRGYEHSVCFNRLAPLQSFFSLVFCVSKIMEFGDTAFVILRKSPLNVLHWYHHATVCIFSWYSLSIQSSPATWYCPMNFAVHSAMYSYYAVKAAGVRLPSGVSQVITVSQMVQFVAGVVVTCSVTFFYHVRGEDCLINTTCNIMGMGIYTSYIVLFGNFYVQRYIKPGQKKVK